MTDQGNVSGNPDERGAWSSKMGFILAAAGSAIGLGNIWRFPITAEASGGGAFVLVYIFCVFAIGIPVMIVELSIGRKTGSNAVGAFKKLVPGSAWKILGGLGVLTGLMILSAYAVVAGWILKYIWYALSGYFSGLEAAQIDSTFTTLAANAPQALILHLLFIFATIAVVAGGIQGGIERSSRMLMPVLLGLLVLLSIRSVTLDGAAEGLSFYLYPDFSKISLSVVMAALGQAFFSLSLGMGAMITYGSYISKKDNLATSATWVCSMDSAIAILAGLVIFPALYSFPELLERGRGGGPGLIFQVLPNIFESIPFGGAVGLGFFFLVAIAALTSTISLLEVVVAYFIEEWKWTRRKSAIVLGLAAFVVGIPSTLSHGAVDWLTNLEFMSTTGFMNVIFTVFGSLALVVGALGLCVFAGYKWGLDKAVEEIRSGSEFRSAPIWGFMVKFACPAAILAILITSFVIPWLSN